MPELHSIQPLWPFMLWALLLLPLLMGFYAWRERRRAQAPEVLQWFGVPAAAQGAAGPSVTPTRAGFWARHGLALWMAVGLACVLLALSRPRAVLLLPARMETVMLAIDSSGSMRSQDVSPSRIAAAQAVARQFIERQPAFVKLGVVSMSGTASLVQAPTDDREALARAIEHMPLQAGSALGSGLLIGLAQLLPNAGLNVDKLLNPEAYRPDPSLPREHPANRSAVPAVKHDPGSHTSGVIVMLSDGESNLGPELPAMAQVAADLGVRVFTIGVGTPQGTVLKAEGVQARVKLDEAALQNVAQRTRGEYFRAVSVKDIDRIYDALSLRIVLQKHQLTEVTGLLALVGMLWMLAGAAWSVARRGRPF